MLVDSSEDGQFTIVVKNPYAEPLCLKKGEVVGLVHPVDILETGEQEDDNVPKVNMVLPNSVSSFNRSRDLELMRVLGIDQTKLEFEQRDELVTLILRYADVFALRDEELGVTGIAQHKIETGEAQPIKQYARRIPHAMREEVNTMIKDMLRRKVIRQSRSPWASPVVLVTKKDGTLRFCVDYRRLNSVTKPDIFPLPRIDDYLDVLSGAKYFSTLDLSSGFWQVEMDPESIEKIAFVTHNRSYEFTVMPFGLVNAPSTFQRLMETVMADLMPEKCLTYIDDVLVIGESFEEHLANLEAVLTRLREANLKLKPSKCKLMRDKVTYLGYCVSAEGISADPGKLDAVKKFPIPTDVKQVRSFVGLTSYYRRFIKSYAKVAKPLHNLTRKNTKFCWSKECQEAFEKLKNLLTSAPTLAFPDFEQPFILETDASGVGLGAVLAQRGQAGETRPIAFANRTLQGAEKRYSVTELEALGVVWAVKHFRHYIYGHHCTVITDHQPLRSLLNTPHPSGKLVRWGLALHEVNLEIVYRPGCKNSAADALSRVPLHATSGRDGGYEVKVVNCETQTEHTLVLHTPCKPTNAYTFNRSLSSPQKEESLSSPQEEESLSSPQEESLSSPQEESLSSPQEESFSSPQEESLSSLQEELLSSPQEEESLSSLQEEESLSSPQEEELLSSPQEESLSSPQEELLSSLQEEESSLQLAGDISTEELLAKRTHVSNTHTQDNINMFPLCTHVQTPAHA